MTYTLQQSISRMRLRAGSATLTLAVVLILGVVATQTVQAQTLTVLYNFFGSEGGAYPITSVIADPKGNLYGTTKYGGYLDCNGGCGVVFKLSPDLNTGWRESVLHTFMGWPADATYPSGLVRDANGNLYGTGGGGDSSYGGVFKLSKSGKLGLLHSFAGGTTDGCEPSGDLVMDADGNLYGTTWGCGASNYGTVFKVSKAGKEKILHSFGGGTTEGCEPSGALVMDSNGNLYGVTWGCGASNYGVVYKLDKKGKLTQLHSFVGGTTDGCQASGPLVMDANGNLYGTALRCGASNYGAVYKLDRKGKLTLLHSFAGGTTDGANPHPSMIMDAKGNLYGDTESGGASGAGTVYELNQTGTLTLLHSFAGGDGQYPMGGLLRDAKGNLYGTAFAGGRKGFGTVWKLTP